jgi:serine/threonine-protein kinase
VLGARLGTGALHTTYRARDTRSGRDVALRVIVPPAERAHEVYERLRASTAAVVALRHAGLVAPVAVDRDGDAVLWVTPFLEGGNVDELLELHEPLPFDAVLALVTDAAAALAQAHARGLVHGGLKPTNLFADADGRARVTDLGIQASQRARAAQGEAEALNAYAAPEQWRGQLPDACADQYALAVIAYELITGQRRPKTMVEGIATLEPLEVQTLAPLRPELDMRVNEVLRTALSASPVNRFATVTEFAQALAAAGRPRATRAAHGGLFSALGLRHLAVAAAVALAGALVALALDPDVRRALHEKLGTLSDDASASAAALEARTARAGARALGGTALPSARLALRDGTLDRRKPVVRDGAGRRNRSGTAADANASTAAPAASASGGPSARSPGPAGGATATPGTSGPAPGAGAITAPSTGAGGARHRRRCHGDHRRAHRGGGHWVTKCSRRPHRPLAPITPHARQDTGVRRDGRLARHLRAPLA